MGQLTPVFLLTLAFAAVTCMPLRRGLLAKAEGSRAAGHLGALGYLGALVVLVACMLTLASGAYNPFIYFRF